MGLLNEVRLSFKKVWNILGVEFFDGVVLIGKVLVRVVF